MSGYVVTREVLGRSGEYQYHTPKPCERWWHRWQLLQCPDCGLYEIFAPKPWEHPGKNPRWFRIEIRGRLLYSERVWSRYDAQARNISKPLGRRFDGDRFREPLQVLARRERRKYWNRVKRRKG